MRLPITLTREGFAYSFVLSFVFAVALLREINLLYIIAGLLVGPLVCNLVFAMTMLRSLRVARRLPHAVASGDTIVVHVSLANLRKRWGAWLIVAEDRIERKRNPSSRRITASTWFPHVAAGQTRHASYRGELVDRGRYRFGPLSLSCRFPLGLVRRTIVVSLKDDVVVYPRLGRLTPRAELLWRHTRQGAHRASRQGRGDVEFHGLRDWQRGDSRRWIHWRSTARRGDIVVREFERTEDHDLVVLLDLGASGSPRYTAEIGERAISIAATFVAEACRGGGVRVVLAVAADREVYMSGAASPAMAEEMLTALADITLAPSSADGGDETTKVRHREQRFKSLTARIADQIRPTTPVVVVSTRDLSEMGEVTARAAAIGVPGRWLVIDARDKTADGMIDFSTPMDASRQPLADSPTPSHILPVS